MGMCTRESDSLEGESAFKLKQITKILYKILTLYILPRGFNFLLFPRPWHEQQQNEKEQQEHKSYENIHYIILFARALRVFFFLFVYNINVAASNVYKWLWKEYAVHHLQLEDSNRRTAKYKSLDIRKRCIVSIDLMNKMRLPFGLCIVLIAIKWVWWEMRHWWSLDTVYMHSFHVCLCIRWMKNESSNNDGTETKKCKQYQNNSHLYYFFCSLPITS